jgi:hypothetical protein
MTKNVGGIDQILRVVLGIGAIGMAAMGGLPTWGVVVAGAVGAIALVTGTLGYCPVWTLLGMNTTCPLNKRET